MPTTIRWEAKNGEKIYLLIYADIVRTRKVLVFCLGCFFIQKKKYNKTNAMNVMCRTKRLCNNVLTWWKRCAEKLARHVWSISCASMRRILIAWIVDCFFFLLSPDALHLSLNDLGGLCASQYVTWIRRLASHKKVLV